MDYREHTKQRFKEKFVPINLQSNKKVRKFWKDKINKQWLELTDDDYDNLCNICRNEPLLIQGERSRVLVQYNQMYIWCIMTKNKKVVKTIYPIDKGDYNKYLKKLVS